MKLIDLYKEWMETGEMPEFPGGLCHNVPLSYWSILELFTPDVPITNSYWASDAKKEWNRWYGFNPLRQTIVLLICAMCDEL